MNKIKRFDRCHLPEPYDYFVQYFPHLKKKSRWVSVLCCFHEEKRPSLRLNLETGAFRCFGCGVRGGDILSFHQQRYQLTFVEAARFFGAWHESTCY